MKKLYFVVPVLICLFAGAGFAQARGTTLPQETTSARETTSTSAATAAPASNFTLEGVCAKLSSKSNTTGSFTQTKNIKANGRALKSYGKFIICPLGILWNTEKPFPSKMVLTKDTMAQTLADGSKSVMNGKDNQIFENISKTLSSVFSGNAEELKNNFTCTFQNKEAGSWKLILLPKDSTIASVMKQLILSGTITGGEKENAVLTSLEISEQSGNSILYEFSNQKYPQELTADEKLEFKID